MTVPFGGYKQRGNGRDKSLHALEKFTELKTIWISLEALNDRTYQQLLRRQCE